MSGITLEGISKSFGQTRVLDDLDLMIPEASVTAMLGESGSGKTTLLRVVAGFERPEAGRILIGGDLVEDGRVFVLPERRRIGYVPQEGALFPHLTVARNIGFGLSRRQAKPERSARIAELLALVGMEGMGARYPHELSGGQQQRVALARALAPGPRAILLDEPFSSLDAGLRSAIRAEVVQILRKAGVTAVLVTHDQEEALSVADLVGVLIDGKVRQLAVPERLYAEPADEEVAGFLGEANLVPTVISAGAADTAFGRLRLKSPSRDGVAVALIRPEQLVIVAHATEGVRGMVVHREFYGHDAVLLVATENCPGVPIVRVRQPGGSSVKAGDTVRLSASGETVVFRGPSSS